MQPRASNPSGSSLLDKSTAHPGNVDMSIFDKKSGQNANERIGQGKVSSNYLQQCREDNPEPPPAAARASVQLSECKINTPSDRLDVGKDFEVLCRVDFINDYTPTNAKVILSFITKFEELEEECEGSFSGILNLDTKSQTMAITGKLPSPPSKPNKGTKVRYIAKVGHKEAEKVELSSPVELIITYSDNESDVGEHIAERIVTIKNSDGCTLIGANYVLCENGNVVKKGCLNENSQFSYKAKPNCKYSVYMVNAGKIKKENSK